MADAESGRSAAGPLVRLHIAPSRTFWRIGPAWSVLAGALAAGTPLLAPDALFRLAAAAVLADLLWGALRQFVSAGRGDAPTAAPPALLPYARADAPLATFLAGLGAWEGETPRAPWQALLLGLVLAAAVSALLGAVAVLLTLIALLILVLMRGWTQRTGGAALGDALLDVALPWLLGAALAGWGAVSWQVLVLAGAFSLLHWGVLRRAQGGRAILAWLGQGAIVAALVAVQRPWGVAGVASLLAPPAWWLALPRGGGLIRALPWWWAAMLLAALAVR